MKGFKTATYAGVLVAIIQVPEVQELIKQYPDVAVYVNSTVIVFLRTLSTSPIFNKGE